MVMKSQFSALLVSIFIISACGGGGGGGGGSAAAPTPSAPSIGITFSSTATQANTGDEVTLTWSTSNASSCSGTGSWSGDKGVSGSETLALKKSGSVTFTLSCSSASSSSSKNVSISVNPVLNAYAYIDGPTTFSGFYIFKGKDISLMMKSIEVDMDINDQDSLYITNFRYSENRYLGTSRDADGNLDRQGVRLGVNYNVDESGEQKTFYIPQVSEVFHSTNQILLNTDNTINPYTYSDNTDSLDDLEILSANIALDFDPEYIPTYTFNGNEALYSHDNIKMSVMAFPRENEATFDAVFVGSSNNTSAEEYAFLYLVDKRQVDANANNLPTESDIFNKNLAMVDIFTSYMSQPNLDLITENGFRTKTDFAQLNNTSQSVADTLSGARLADAIDLSTNETNFGGNNYAIKYLQPDDTSTQRVFLKTSLTDDSTFGNDCFSSTNRFRSCNAINWQLYFFTPDKEALVGLILGGYFGSSNKQTNARLLLDND